MVHVLNQISKKPMNTYMYTLRSIKGESIFAVFCSHLFYFTKQWNINIAKIQQSITLV